MRRASQFGAILFVVVLVIMGIGVAIRSISPESVRPSAEVAQTIQTSLIVNSETFTTDLPSGSTALDLMARAQEASFLSYAGKEYVGMGFLVTTINNVASSDDHYWIYSINGESARVGVNDYVLQPFDLIEWTYEASTTK